VRSTIVGLAVVVLAGCAPVGAVPKRKPVPSIEPHAVNDPINTRDITAMRAIAQQVLDRLIAALPDEERRAVAGVTLATDSMDGTINAYATCGGGPIVAISDRLLEIEAQLAATRAADELFETTKMHEYIRWMGKQAAAKKSDEERASDPLPTPDLAWYGDAHTDLRKISIQRVLFEEGVAYVLGHELAHHYLGHLACAGDGGTVDGVVILARAIPLFSQAAEVAADVAAIENVLAVGNVARAAGRRAWTEEGALVLLEFIHYWDKLDPGDILLAFLASHPLPAARIPIVMHVADRWRLANAFAL
jgi:hypothetical protein